MTTTEVPLGGSGISIAPLGVGTVSWGGTKVAAYGGTDSREAEEEALATLLQAGVTLVDTAEAYGNEERIGELVKGHPEVVLATKYAPWPWRGRRSVRKALDRSLGKLGTNRIDLYQAHQAPRPMSITSLMQEFGHAHHDGKVRAVGVSNFTSAQMREAFDVLHGEGIALASNQVQYSLLHRSPETNGVLEACRELGVALIAYQPLASGALTGKYDAQNRPTGMRRFLPSFRSKNLEALPAVIALLEEIADAQGAVPSQVALRWLIQQGTIPIPGAKNAKQASANAGALAIELGEAEMNALDTATTRWRR